MAANSKQIACGCISFFLVLAIIFGSIIAFAAPEYFRLFRNECTDDRSGSGGEPTFQRFSSCSILAAELRHGKTLAPKMMHKF